MDFADAGSGKGSKEAVLKDVEDSVWQEPN